MSEYAQVAALLQSADRMREVLELVRFALSGPGDPRAVLPDVEAALEAAQGDSE